MLLSATLMWALCRWLPMAHWIGRPWNRVGALPAAIGLALIVAAIRRFRHARTTVNPMHPGKATQLVTDGEIVSCSWPIDTKATLNQPYGPPQWLPLAIDTDDVGLDGRRVFRLTDIADQQLTIAAGLQRQTINLINTEEL